MICRLKMIHKRPFVDNDSYEFACKHPRQLEYIDQLTPIFPLDDADKKPRNSAEDSSNEYQELGRLRSCSAMEVSDEVQQDVETGATGCFPHFFWINNEAPEADNLALFPHCFENEEQLKEFLSTDGIHSPVDCPFQKLVLIGPEHQAEIPEWNLEDMKSYLKQLHDSDSQSSLAQSSNLRLTVNHGYKEKLMGSCVLPMPESEPSASPCSEGTRIECACVDGSSIRCTRQHIAEARQKLRNNLGEQTFEALGFCNMGEEIANRWTEDEQQAFHEVVLSNPASLGKNFWDHLSEGFLSRPKWELVSYYFNVFTLQKRAEQNRFEPQNVDSDDDEWQRGEIGMAEGDDDSVVETLTAHDAYTYNQLDQAYQCSEYIEDEDEFTASDSNGNRVACDVEYEGDLDDISGDHILISLRDYSNSHCIKHLTELPANKGDDDSCTSDEYQRDNADCCLPLGSRTDRGTYSQE
ncbi:hypothetical protein K2173_014103 [Erythroxylum novogranatense]|uniref:AT-rich interactive domain-containing protein 2 n=1 Tax=Erythroxylum novogranatense TaxID=1862640 RepID=A0AAV8SDP2_9ROSI|nr:hypothetical protein K2173_014103 [Erythroxylum novogranatense]